MSEAQIVVEKLSKTYRVMQRGEGMRAALGSFFKRSFADVPAVREVSFSIARGEMVGFIGPNGAGKTTTLKMLAGLLTPTSGTARVAGFTPHERRPDFLRRVSMVLGNKSQMLWEIPPLDSFRVLGEIYSVPPAEYRATLDELIALLEMEPILLKPVRTLSLGERMKCELTAALLYRPEVLFLDEPTLGLDVSMQARLRQFLKEYNRRSGFTAILTSHYMADVTALCPRVILIDQGQLLFSGALSELALRLAPFKLLRLSLAEAGALPFSEVGSLPLPERPEVTLTGEEGGVYTLRVPRAITPLVTAELLQRYQLADLTVEDPPIEAVIDQVYQEGVPVWAN